MIDYISFFEKQLERVNYWLSYAETKNAASIISFFCEHYNVRNGNCFLPCVKYKSYYHRFTA